MKKNKSDIPADDLRRRVDGERLRQVREGLGVSFEALVELMPKNAPLRNIDALSRLQRCRQGDELPSLDVTPQFLEAVYEAFKKAAALKRKSGQRNHALEQVQRWGGWQALLRGGDRIPLGREEQYDKVKTFLLSERIGEKWELGLTGTAGVGKTHLMRAIEQDEDIKLHYDGKIASTWVGPRRGCAGDPSCEIGGALFRLAIQVANLFGKEIALLLTIIANEGDGIKEKTQITLLQETVRDCVGDSRVALFIDDVWEQGLRT